MENIELITELNKRVAFALTDRKELVALKEAADKNDAPFNTRYGLEKSIGEVNVLLDHLWSALGAAIGYDLRILCAVMEEAENGKEVKK